MEANKSVSQGPGAVPAMAIRGNVAQGDHYSRSRRPAVSQFDVTALDAGVAGRPSDPICLSWKHVAERRMPNTVRVFNFKDHGFTGLSVIAGSGDLCPGCVTVEEIDTNIQNLKEDLDAVGKRMKTALLNRPPLVPRR